MRQTSGFRLFVALLIVGILGCYGLSCSRTLVLVQSGIPIVSKKAVLVLPGLRNSAKGYRDAKRWFQKQGYDAFIPDYVSNEGFTGSVENLRAFILEHRLEEYDEVYAYGFLMGGWTLNKYLEKYDFPALKKIIYDRSPYQEQAPRIVLEVMPGVIHLLFGKAVDELRDTPYPALPKGDRTIGILVECKATSFISRRTERLEPILAKQWLPEAFVQQHDDIIYVFLDHDELYYSYDEIGKELLSFFETGRFTKEAPRKRVEGDPFD